MCGNTRHTKTNDFCLILGKIKNFSLLKHNTNLYIVLVDDEECKSCLNRKHANILFTSCGHKSCEFCYNYKLCIETNCFFCHRDVDKIQIEGKFFLTITFFTN